MEKVLEILKEIINIDNIESKTNLVDGKFLSSSNIIRLVSRLNNEFDIAITPMDLIPENFNSAKSIESLVSRLEEE